MSMDQLHQAIFNNDSTKVLEIISTGADVNLRYGHDTAFIAAVQKHHLQCADIIINCESFNPNATDQFESSPLHIAAKYGHDHYINRLLDMGADVNSINTQGLTPLGVSAWHGTYRCAELLTSRGASLTVVDKQGRTPLMIACSFVNLEVVKVLLTHGCDVNSLCPDMRTPLFYALPTFYNKHVSKKKLSDMITICELVINAGCDINKQDKQGWSALHHAVDRDCIHSVCLLAERNCLLDLKDTSGLTPLHLCIKKRPPHYEIAQLLVYYGAKVNIEIPIDDGYSINPLLYLFLKVPQTHTQVKEKQNVLQNVLFESQIPPYLPCERVWSKGMTLSSLPNDLLNWLQTPPSLQHLSKIYIRNLLSGFNLLPKVQSLHLGNTLKRFLNLGLEDTVNFFHLCTLHVCISEFDNEKAENLLKTGVSIEFPLNGKFPLEIAIEMNNIEFVKTIFRLRPQTGLTNLNSDGDNIFHLLSRHRLDSIIQLIPSAVLPPRPARPGPRGASQFRGARRKESVSLMGLGGGGAPPKCPVPRGAGSPSMALLIPDMNLINNTNRLSFTPLQTAVKSGNFDTAEMLLKHGALIIDNPSSYPLLHLAAASGATSFLQLLLSKGVDSNTIDCFGNSPLHLAASKGNEYLMFNIELPALYTHQALAALDICRRSVTGQPSSLTRQDADHAGVVETLLQYGADPTILNNSHRTPIDSAHFFQSNDLVKIFKQFI